MEILDYARSKGWLLAILVLLPLLAGGTAFVLLGRQPERYSSQLEVAIPTPVASGVSGVGLYIANFRQSITSTSVVGRVAEATGMAPDQLAGGLEVEQVGQANRMVVKYTGTAPDLAADIVPAAAAATLEQLATARLDFERRRLAIAEEQYERARGEVETFSTDTGLVFPEDDYRSIIDELRGLENELALAEKSGLLFSAAELRIRMDELRARRDALAPQVLVYQRLDETSENASGARRDMGAAVLDAEAQLQLLLSPELVADVTTAPVPRTQTLLAGVGLAAATALGLALAIVTLPDLLRRPRRRALDDEGGQQIYLPEGETAAERAPTSSR